MNEGPTKSGMDEQRLRGRVALVTGGARGIGEAIVRRLAKEGAAIVVADIDLSEAQNVTSSLQNASAIQVDIGEHESVLYLAAEIERIHAKLDILVNNAAIPDTTRIMDLTIAHYRRILQIVLDGAVDVTLATVPLIKKAGRGGRIVNIASIMGLRGSRDALPYSTAKGGIVNFTRALACDLADDGINVNAICPGFINTRMAVLPDGSGHEHQTEWFREVYMKHGRIPLRRPGQPDDVAGAAYFFCSDDSAYVTGQLMLVDGGLSATF